MITGLATAMMDSAPMVAITGQVGRSAIGTDAFQETDITGATLPVTKHNYLVKLSAYDFLTVFLFLGSINSKSIFFFFA